MHITLCDLVSTWDSLSPTQKKSLNQRYQMGCECKVSGQAAQADGVCCSKAGMGSTVTCSYMYLCRGHSTQPGIWEGWLSPRI